MRYLAIDLGQKRVGLAISDAGQSMAFPLVVLDAGAGLISRVAQIVQSEKAGAVVIGLPLNMDGSEGPRAKASREFAAQLTKAVSVPITLFDELLSSVPKRIGSWPVRISLVMKGKSGRTLLPQRSFFRHFSNSKKKP